MRQFWISINWDLVRKLTYILSFFFLLSLFQLRKSPYLRYNKLLMSTNNKINKTHPEWMFRFPRAWRHHNLGFWKLPTNFSFLSFCHVCISPEMHFANESFNYIWKINSKFRKKTLKNGMYCRSRFWRKTFYLSDCIQH